MNLFLVTMQGSPTGEQTKKYGSRAKGRVHVFVAMAETSDDAVHKVRLDTNPHLASWKVTTCAALGKDVYCSY